MMRGQVVGRGAGFRRSLQQLVVVVAASTAVAGCGVDPGAGLRFRAERDLYHADAQYRELNVRPAQVPAARWKALARRYGEIGGRYAKADRTGGEAGRQASLVAARALFAAAQIHAMLGDSADVETIYLKMAEDFDQIPEVAGEVAMARGQMAEDRGQGGRAADLYEVVVNRIQPRDDEGDLSARILELPLRIAQLRATPAAYEWARSYYGRLREDGAGELVQFGAQGRLADLAAAHGDWNQAAHELESLEARLVRMKDPPHEPSEIRLAIAGMHARAGWAPAKVQVELDSILTDYPNSKVIPEVLTALAHNADARGHVDEALGYLDRIVREQKDEEVVSQALLDRGRLLDAHDRWREASQALQTVSAEHPLTEAALLAPLAMAEHYARKGDQAGAGAEYSRAERNYRDFIERYPPSQLTLFAREQLISSLMLQKNYDAAITEMTDLGEKLAGTPQGASVLIAAAHTAYKDLSDSTRAAKVLDRLSELYRSAGVGKWATGQAARLRGGSSP